MTPAEQVADQLAVCGDEGIVRTTPAEVLATLTAQAPPAAPAVLEQHAAPSQVRCPICWAGPGWYCRDFSGGGNVLMEEPHLNRVTVAEQTPREGVKPVPAAAGTAQPAAVVLAERLQAWDEGGRAVPVVEAARGLLVEHERMRAAHGREMFAAGEAVGTVLRNREEAIAALTAERDRLAGQVQDYADTVEEVEGGDGWEAIVADLRRIVGGAS